MQAWPDPTMKHSGSLPKVSGSEALGKVAGPKP